VLPIQSILSSAVGESSDGSAHFLDLVSRRRCPWRIGADGRGVSGATGCVRPNSYGAISSAPGRCSKGPGRVHGELCCPFNLSYRAQSVKVQVVRRIFLILSPGVGARGELGPMVVAFPRPLVASAELLRGYIERTRQMFERNRHVHGELCCPFNLSYRTQSAKVQMVRHTFLILSPGVGARGELGPMVVAFPGPQAASDPTPTGLYRAHQADVRKEPSLVWHVTTTGCSSTPRGWSTRRKPSVLRG